MLLGLLATVVHFGGLLQDDLGRLAFHDRSVSRRLNSLRFLEFVRLLALTLILGVLLASRLFQVGRYPERFHFLYRITGAVHSTFTYFDQGFDWLDEVGPEKFSFFSSYLSVHLHN